MQLSGYIRLTLMVLLAGVVTGCVSEAELQANDRGRCGSFGFQPGSSEFGNCMMKLTLQRDEIVRCHCAGKREHRFGGIMKWRGTRQIDAAVLARELFGRRRACRRRRHLSALLDGPLGQPRRRLGECGRRG